MEKNFKIIKDIWKFINSPIFLLGIIFILFIMLSKTCSDYKEEQRQNTINEQNNIAMRDSLRIEKTKSGGLQVSIAGYIASEKELKNLNEKLYKEVSEQKGKVLSLNKIIFQLKQDTSILNKHINYLESLMGQPIKINDSTYSVSWQLRYDWDELNYDIYNGTTYIGTRIKTGFVWKDGLTSNELLSDALILTHQKTLLNNKLSQMELKFGQKIEDKQLKIFVETNYPGFTPKSLEGVLIDPNTNPYIKSLMKKKHFFPNTWSVGIGGSTGYNLFTSKPYFGVGVNLTYNLLQW
jgi:hypothetical protein